MTKKEIKLLKKEDFSTKASFPISKTNHRKKYLNRLPVCRNCRKRYRDTLLMPQLCGFPRRELVAESADSIWIALPLFWDYLKKSSHFEFNGCKTW